MIYCFGRSNFEHLFCRSSVLKATLDYQSLNVQPSSIKTVLANWHVVIEPNQKKFPTLRSRSSGASAVNTHIVSDGRFGYFGNLVASHS